MLLQKMNNIILMYYKNNYTMLHFLYNIQFNIQKFYNYTFFK